LTSFHPTPPGSPSLLQVSINSEEVHMTPPNSNAAEQIARVRFFERYIEANLTGKGYCAHRLVAPVFGHHPVGESNPWSEAARIASVLPWCFPATIWEGQPKGQGLEKEAGRFDLLERRKTRQSSTNLCRRL
jgi:hypothetical protein